MKLEKEVNQHLKQTSLPKRKCFWKTRNTNFERENLKRNFGLKRLLYLKENMTSVLEGKKVQNEENTTFEKTNKEILVWQNFCRTNLSTFEQILAFEQKKLCFWTKKLCFWTKKTLLLNKEHFKYI